MSNPQEKQLNPAEKSKKIVITLKTFCVVTDEPEEFKEKLDQLCQEHCDTAGDYFFVQILWLVTRQTITHLNSISFLLFSLNVWMKKAFRLTKSSI